MEVLRLGIPEAWGSLISSGFPDGEELERQIKNSGQDNELFIEYSLTVK